MDQARYDTFIVAKYLDTATDKISKKFYKTTLTADMIFTKKDASTRDQQVEKLTREVNIHYRVCIGSLIYLLSTRVELSFAVYKLAKLSENPGKPSNCTLPGFSESFANFNHSDRDRSG